MTLEELRSMDAVFITPQIAARFLKCDPHLIRVQARADPAALGFPVTVLKSRTKIPRLPFIQHIEGRTYEERTQTVHLRHGNE